MRSLSVFVDIDEAKANLSPLLDQAHAGQEIVLVKGGKPYARLMPLSSEPPRREPGRLSSNLGNAFFERLPDNELGI